MRKARKQQFQSGNKGAAALPTVIALTILIVAMSASLASTSLVDSFMAYGFAQSSKAYVYAEAGAKDALVRIARDKKYTCDTPSSGCYEINFVSGGCLSNEGCAKITVSASSSPKVIISEGRNNDNIRKVRVEVTFDASQNGKIDSVNWQEVTN